MKLDVNSRHDSGPQITKKSQNRAVEDFSHGCENKIRDSDTVMPRETLLICYQGNTYAVKDICVDEGVLIKDNIYDDIIKVSSDGNRNVSMTKESDDDEFLSPAGSLQSSENSDDNDAQEIKCLSENSFVSDGTSSEAKCSATEKIVADVSPSPTLSQDFSSKKSLMSYLLSPDYDGHELDDKAANKIPCSEVEYENSVSDSPNNSKMGCRTKTACENSGDEAQQSHGESSLLEAGQTSGGITCSGPMLIYSGSVSIRSESSSTRSFAFPILQPEWHTSPVKMSKPDGKKYRKHGGWRQALICCKF